MKHILEVDSINLEFSGRKILSDVYLKCETGKITGLLGRNGQGKSCLMQTIFGYLRCERSIRIDNRPRQILGRSLNTIRYLPQFNFIPKPLSLERAFQDFELDFSSFYRRWPEFKTRYKEKIQRFSGGDRRLIEFYLVVKSNTLFVILDEPFTHLNPSQIEKVKDLLDEEKENKGIIVTDHLYKNIIEISDSLYVLLNGKTYLTKTMEDIISLGYANAL
jgi:ABC-type lipopolysaccharide export system ATPase subunit